MNLVEVIKSQLSSALMNQLSSLIGAGEGATKSAVNAAVPSLLAALSKLVSSGDGIQMRARATRSSRSLRPS